MKGGQSLMFLDLFQIFWNFFFCCGKRLLKRRQNSSSPVRLPACLSLLCVCLVPDFVLDSFYIYFLDLFLVVKSCKKRQNSSSPPACLPAPPLRLSCSGKLGSCRCFVSRDCSVLRSAPHLQYSNKCLRIFCLICCKMNSSDRQHF